MMLREPRAAAIPDVAQRRFPLGLMSDQVEGGLGAGLGAGTVTVKPPSNPYGHVDAWRVAAVGAAEVHPIARHGDLVQGRGPEQRRSAVPGFFSASRNVARPLSLMTPDRWSRHPTSRKFENCVGFARRRLRAHR